MKSLCTGSPMGEPAPPGRVLTPPNPRLVQSEGGAQARVHPSLRLLRVRWGGGTRRPPDLASIWIQILASFPPRIYRREVKTTLSQEPITGRGFEPENTERGRSGEG